MNELSEFVDKELKKIEDDERYHYKPALAIVNAPLALIQAEMEARMVLLKQIKIILNRGKNKSRGIATKRSLL